MPTLSVKGLDSSEWGHSIIRLHYKHRRGIGRYGVARIINASDRTRHCDVVLLGHDDETAIFMAYDNREALGVAKGEDLSFEVEELGLLRKLWWYLRTPDPRIYIPAWLAAWSVCLGVIGIVLAIISMLVT